jgi:hypothetical protein
LEISGKGYERMRGASVKPTLIKHLSASAAAKRIGSNVGSLCRRSAISLSRRSLSLCVHAIDFKVCNSLDRRDERVACFLSARHQKEKKKNAGVGMPPAVFAYVKKFSDDAGREI